MTGESRLGTGVDSCFAFQSSSDSRQTGAVEEKAAAGDNDDGYFFMNEVDFSAAYSPDDSVVSSSMQARAKPKVVPGVLSRPFHVVGGYGTASASGQPEIVQAVPVAHAHDLSEDSDCDADETPTPNFHEWRTLCPELEVFLDRLEDLRAEVEAAAGPESQNAVGVNCWHLCFACVSVFPDLFPPLPPCPPLPSSG